MAPRFTKLPLTAHTLASGDKGPRPITSIWPRVAKNRGLSSFLPRVFTELKPYPLFIFPNRANPHCSSSSLSRSDPPPCPPSAALSITLSIAYCASVHEVWVAGLAPPPNSRRKGGSHCCATVEKEAATVQPSLWPPSRHRRSSVAASCTPPSRCLWLRTLSRVRRALRRASVAPLRHGPPQPPLADKRCTAAPCDCSDEYLVPRSPFPATVAPPILSEVNSKRVIFSFVLYIFFMI